MPETDVRVVDLSPEDDALIDALVPISVRAAAMNSPGWLPTPERARAEIVRVATGPGVCRALVEGGVPRGWAGAVPCHETAWELHPLLVDPERHGGGFGRRLVADVERLAAAAGALTMDLSTSDATGATTLGGRDLFADPLGALARLDVVDPAVGHAFRFWQKAGYAVVGVLPDAEGPGVPSIRLAKSLVRKRGVRPVPEPAGLATSTGTIGVAVGKFNPPHLGHLHLLERGAAEVDRLYVLLCDRPDHQGLSAESRRAWLQDAAPANATVIVTPDDLPAANEPWARRALDVLPAPPSVAFTSETWGPGWAALMGARHVTVDLERERHPISATRLRADLRAHFDWLVPAARAALARRVVLTGAESTGKSTLAKVLAKRLATVWVPEHGRWYWEGRRHLSDPGWSSDEFLRIARAQGHLEDDLARRASGGVVIADTDASVTAAWHERYLGRADAELDALASTRVPDLYIVCEPDIPWVQDGTRESETHRDAMQVSMTRRARASGARTVTVSGSVERRLDTALAAIDACLDLGKLI